MRKILLHSAAAGILGAAALAIMTGSAAAAIVCNDDGDCWHVRDRYEYPAGIHVTWHDDDWRWRDQDRDRYRWREHEGRGYWRNGVWISF